MHVQKYFHKCKGIQIRDYSTRAGHRNEKGLLMQARHCLTVLSTSSQVQVEVTEVLHVGEGE